VARTRAPRTGTWSRSCETAAGSSATARSSSKTASGLSSLRVALATCAEIPSGDDEAGPLTEALAAHGVEAEPAVWDDQGIDWDRFDLVVVRSTWDYPGRREQFLAWAEGLPHVLNPTEVLRWNTDKRYLEILGGDAVPTEFLEPGAEFVAPGHPYVVKPSVGAGSIGAARYDAGDTRAAAHVAELHAAGQTVMVQPYVEEVDRRGETSLIYVRGEFSHAVHKEPILARGGSPAAGSLYVEEQMSPVEAADQEHLLGERVLAALPFAREELLYARIDVVPGPKVLEVELTEPSLFIGYADGAAERLAAAIAATARAEPG
jgi:glutathione synthase/RimK-type ligase-like ATP-grasp enzyme